MSNKSKICAPGEKVLIDGVWYQRVGVLDFSLVECDPPKTNESSKRIDERVIAAHKANGEGSMFLGIRAEEMDRDSLLAFIGWCGRPI